MKSLDTEKACKTHLYSMSEYLWPRRKRPGVHQTCPNGALSRPESRAMDM
jgi:hypothetical protein